jgi:hypothetical protein
VDHAIGGPRGQHERFGVAKIAADDLETLGH